MHILITNDDGYHSLGIRVLVEQTLKRGHEITIISPYKEQSGMSHRLTLRQTLPLYNIEIAGQKGYAIDGSPVDCVRVWKYLSDKPVDACLSGINNGRNTGSAIYYSGTNGAAREAAMLYIPSIAVSIDYGADESMYENLANFALDKLDDILLHPMPRMSFLNINAPAIAPKEIKGVKLCGICSSFYKDNYTRHKDENGGEYLKIAPFSETEPNEPGKDNMYLNEGYITLTFVGGFMDHNEKYHHISF